MRETFASASARTSVAPAGVLPDVADHQVARDAVEREAKRVAQPDREELGIAAAEVEPQQLAQAPVVVDPVDDGRRRLRRLLRVARRVAARAAVAGARVEA